jgi:hypothetical protein
MVCLQLSGGTSYCPPNLLLGDLLLKFVTESICPKMHPSACHGRPGSQAKLLKAGGQPSARLLLPTMVCLRLRGGASYCTLNLLLGDLLLKFITESICPKMHPSACHGRPGSQAKLLKAGGQPRPTLLWHLEQSFIFPASSKGRGGT